MTNKYKKKYIILSIISVLLNILPILIYVVKGFSESSNKGKIALGFCLVIAIMLSTVNILLKFNIRSTIWILLIGIYICLDNIVPLLIIISICTILDEFIVEPLKKSFKNSYLINKEIDKRV